VQNINKAFFLTITVQKIRIFPVYPYRAVNMKKGKARHAQKKYLSIVLIPHSSSNVKVLKFNAFYLKLAAFFIVLIAVFVSGSIYISKIVKENEALKKNITELYVTTTEQSKLIEAKSNEITRLQEESAAFRETVNDKIEEFTESFNKITDEYLQKRSATASRSGERNESAFAGDLYQLKQSLDSLTSLYSRSRILTADLEAAEAKIDAFMETIPTLWPVNGRITDEYGYRKDPINGKRKFHTGLDIAADTGTPIKAAASGKVIFAQSTYATGRTVKIDHGRGIVTLYGHASKILVEEGQTVEKGEVIAKVGSTGRSTGPHLHFEIHLYGSTVDPLEYLEKK